MLIFALTGQAPPILLLALAICVYLTLWDLWQEKDLPVMPKAWWVLLVILTHVVGYIVFRVWIAQRRRRHSTA
jgi:hypothetical protein